FFMFKIGLFLFCLSFVLPLLYEQNAYGQSDENRIAAVVNSQIVTLLEVEERMNLLRVSKGGAQLSPEEISSLRQDALNQLIDEVLQKEEAKKNNISITQEQINIQFESIAKGNSMSVKEFEDILKKQNVNSQTLKNRLHAQLAWLRLIQSELSRLGGVSAEEIDDRVELLMQASGKPSKHLFEIFIPINTLNLKKLEADLKHLVNELRAGRANFKRIAATYSQAVSAAESGDIGWVLENQLPAQLSPVIKELSKGEISDPIKTLSGYYIFKVEDVKISENIEEKTVYDFVLLDGDISRTTLPLEEIDDHLEKMLENINGCGSARRYSREHDWIESLRLKSVEPSALPRPVSTKIEGLERGQNTGWVKQGERVFLAVVCSISNAMGGINRALIEKNILNEKGSKFSRKRLIDLQSSAFIEKRI
ncbi:MAG: peptidylprolyl isomerase, partial [Pseudomonadota bacterium]